MDKIQQEFYSFGADISRVEQELAIKKERAREIEEKLNTNIAQIQSRKGELLSLTQSTKQVEENINLIDSELQKIKEGKDEELNLEESEKIENLWLVFITQSKSILTKLEKNIDSFVESLNNKSSLEKIKELESEVIDLKRELDSIKEEPSKLTKLTQDFLSNSSEDAQQQRVNLIDKTTQFADLQAKFAALTSEDKLANSQLEALELENLSLIDELKALEDPISKYNLI